jgi:hypothetical protein
MDIAIAIGVGLFTGLFTCLWSWWIVARFVRPELVIVPEISKLPDDTGAASWRYRIKLLNKRRRFLPHTAAVDIHVSAAIRVKGLRPDAPDLWYYLTVPVGRTGQLAYMKWNQTLRLRLHDIDSSQTKLLPQDVRSSNEAGSIELERLLDLGERAQLRVVVTAAHAYTFGRTVALHRFKQSAVKMGRFDPLLPRVSHERPIDESEEDVAPRPRTDHDAAVRWSTDVPH